MRVTIASKFLFATCQVGAEAALKDELTTPERRSAFQRPGFVTFKCDARADLVLDSLFARTYGVSLDRLVSVSAERVTAALGRAPDVAHVYARDADDTLLVDAAHAIELPWPRVATKPGQLVADLVVVEPSVVYLGAHIHHRDHSPHAGAVPPISVPEEAPSRAWLKLEDALHRFDFTPRPGEVAIEIGSAPGGAAYALCGHGLSVYGIDPAEMSPVVLGIASFTHVRKPFAHVGRRDLPKRADWLLLDVNVAPAEGAAMVQKCVALLEARPRVCLLTLKLGQATAVKSVLDVIEALRALGYRDLRARQLASSHREVVVCAS